MKPSAVSMNSLSSNTSNHGQGKDLTPPAPHPDENSTLYEKLVWSHQYDPRSKEEVIMNRRVGFYKFKSDLGAGNFSKVKLAHHQLTKGRILNFFTRSFVKRVEKTCIFFSFLFFFFFWVREI